jgi:hypothetical protein
MRMKRRSTLVSIVLGVALMLRFGGSLLAHHGSRISYDLTKTVTLKGTIKEVQYVNPHVYFLFDVKDAQGNVTEWGAETDPPIMLERRYGWSKRYLKAGDEVTVTMWPSKVGASRGFLAKLVTADGKVLDHSEQPQQ